MGACAKGERRGRLRGSWEKEELRGVERWFGGKIEGLVQNVGKKGGKLF